MQGHAHAPDEPARSLLVGDLRRRARAAADGLFARLCRRDASPARVPVPGIGGGDAGVAVALAHWALRRGEDVEAIVAARLARAIAVAQAVPTSWDLFAGWAGLGWAADLLAAADAAALRAIDARVLAGCEAEAEPPLPLVEGLAGVLVLAAQRGVGVLDELVRVSVDRLLAAARPRAVGATWPTAPAHVPDWLRDRHPDGHDNLGVAHGAPGIVAALARLAEADVLDPHRCAQVRAAVRSGCAWMRSIAATATSRMPAWIADDDAPPTEAAWCYGDVGASVALLTAARVLDDRDTERFAVQMARAAIPRASAWCGRNLGICHGHAGVVHLYHRLWRATQDAEFARVARDGCEVILDALRDGDGVPDDEGLLEGRAGIALVLESACDDVAPTWDAILGCDRV